MTPETILVTASYGETRIALLENGRACELFFERDHQPNRIGNIYKGRVRAVLQGIHAAFVDLGLQDGDGYLSLSGKNVEAGPVNEGDEVLVQIQHEAFEDKGPKVTTDITLPGRFLVFSPRHPEEVRVSSRLDDEREINRLNHLTQGFADAFGGFIVRTNAAGVSDEELRHDALWLKSIWEEITDRAPASKTPVLLHAEEPLSHQVLRDWARPDSRVLFDDKASLDDAKAFCAQAMPSLGETLSLYDGKAELFEEYGVEEEIEIALGRTVRLPSGGNLIIESTTALSAIDVNTGDADGGARGDVIRRTNMEATEEIARQLRLRNLQGQIIIDFAGHRKQREDLTDIVDSLRRATRHDKAGTNVFGATRAGLVEVIRRRQRFPLAQVLMGSCPVCDGHGHVKTPATVGLEILRILDHRLKTGAVGNVRLKAPEAVIGVLEGPLADHVEAVRNKLGRPIGMETDPSMAPDEFDIAAG